MVCREIAKYHVLSKMGKTNFYPINPCSFSPIMLVRNQITVNSPNFIKIGWFTLVIVLTDIHTDISINLKLINRPRIRVLTITPTIAYLKIVNLLHKPTRQ